MECIGKECFKSSGMREIVLPRTLREVGENALAHYALTAVWMERDRAPEVSRWVGDSVLILDVREMVGERLLRDLRGQREVVIPEGVRTIEGHWFWKSEVEDVEIPASVRRIDARAFYECEKLRRVSFQPGSRLESVGEECFHKSGIAEIALPDALRGIEYDAFAECRSLRHIRLPEGLAFIGKYGFWDCALESVELPGSLRTVGKGAFAWCTSLKSVRLCEGLEALGADR